METYNGTTKGDAGSDLEASEDEVEDLPTDVVEVAVHIPQCPEVLLERLALVIQRLHPQLVRQPLALVPPARDANDAAALELCDLAHERADRAGRARDDDELAGLGAADVEEAKVGRHAGHADDAERVGGREGGREGELGEVLGGEGGELLPACGWGRGLLSAGVRAKRTA